MSGCFDPKTCSLRDFHVCVSNDHVTLARWRTWGHTTWGEAHILSSSEHLKNELGVCDMKLSGANQLAAVRTPEEQRWRGRGMGNRIKDISLSDEKETFMAHLNEILRTFETVWNDKETWRFTSDFIRSTSPRRIPSWRGQGGQPLHRNPRAPCARRPFTSQLVVGGRVHRTHWRTARDRF